MNTFLCCALCFLWLKTFCAKFPSPICASSPIIHGEPSKLPTLRNGQPWVLFWFCSKFFPNLMQQRKTAFSSPVRASQKVGLGVWGRHKTLKWCHSCQSPLQSHKWQHSCSDCDCSQRCLAARGTASFSQWQLHIKHHNEHQIIPEDTGNICPSPAHSWRSTVARVEQVKGIWVTLQLLDTIQGSGERSGRAAMLQDKDVLAPFASPWPHLLLLGYVPNTVPFARGLKVYGSALFVMSFPGFSSLLSIFSPSFPFLEFEMKVV